MGRFVGIDIRATHVRAVVLRVSYRRVTLERMLEVDVAAPDEAEQALAACALPLVPHSDGVAICVDGEQSFIHRMTLPATALKQIAEVLPFELEAQMPVDLDELVYDYRILRRGSADAPVVAVAAAARTDLVRQRIAMVERVVGRAPERVAVGPLSLANLATLSEELAAEGPVALVDLGGARSEVVVLGRGEPCFARTLSRGVAGLPESAPALTAELRQTIGAWTAQGGAPIQAVFLLGGGAHAPGAEAYLSHELGIAVRQLPALAVEGVTPELADAVPRFAKAISLAVGLSNRAKDLDLRRGPLSFTRGFGFLKEKVPVLAGLGIAIAVSFLFATWAELRTLRRDREVLTKALAAVSKEVLGQEASDAEEARALLEKAQGKDELDPMPRIDGFDVMVEISKAVPSNVTHDIEELDFHRGHVKINGVVGSAADAQTIAGGLKSVRCFHDVKVSKVSQVINSDRHKYVLEFDAKCADDAAKKKKKPEGSTEPATE